MTLNELKFSRRKLLALVVVLACVAGAFVLWGAATRAPADQSAGVAPTGSVPAQPGLVGAAPQRNGGQPALGDSTNLEIVVTGPDEVLHQVSPLELTIEALAAGASRTVRFPERGPEPAGDSVTDLSGLPAPQVGDIRKGRITVGFIGLPRDKYRLTLQPAPLGNVELDSIVDEVDTATSQTATLAIERCLVRFELRLLDAAKRPLPSARFEVAGPPPFRASAAADPAGGVALCHTPPGDLAIRVLDYAGSELLDLPETRQLSVQAGDNVRVDFLMPHTEEVVLSASSASEDSVPFTLALWRKSGSEHKFFALSGLLSPHPSGAWLGRLPPGNYRARATPRAAYAVSWAEFDVQRNGVPTEVKFTLEEVSDVPVQLRIVDLNGIPQGRQQFNVNALDWPGEGGLAVSAKADSNGMATTRPLPPGRYAVWIWQSQLMCFLQHDAVPQQHTLTLPSVACEGADCASLRVELDVEGGGSVRAVGLVVAPEGMEESTLTLMRFVRKSGAGTYEGSGFKPGLYRLWLCPEPDVSPDIQPTWSEPIVLRPGEQTNFRFRISKR